jgi:hypothetical protein
MRRSLSCVNNGKGEASPARKDKLGPAKRPAGDDLGKVDAGRENSSAAGGGQKALETVPLAAGPLPLSIRLTCPPAGPLSAYEHHPTRNPRDSRGGLCLGRLQLVVVIVLPAVCELQPLDVSSGRADLGRQESTMRASRGAFHWSPPSHCSH